MRLWDRAAGHVETLRAVVDVADAGLAGAVAQLPDAAVHALITETTALMRLVESVRVAAAGTLAARSRCEAGHSGVAQREGHRTVVAAVQEATGSTRAEATRQVRLGEALLAGAAITTAEGAAGAAAGADATSEGVGASGDEERAAPWHAPLSVALIAGALSVAQHDAILRGLGEPPPGEEWVEAWRIAATQLLAEARLRTVEDLGGAARAVRDQLDPEGAARRFGQRFENRSFRMWRDTDGVHRASIAFDDEMAAWVRGVLDSALRPRRGGPRFVTDRERAAAQELIDDPRSNDQLAYDLVMDVLRAGTLATAEQVHGVRQAGVRVVVTAAALSTDPATADPRLVDDLAQLDRLGVATSQQPPSPQVGHLEDSSVAIPVTVIAGRMCDVGATPVVTDRVGNPLFLGRTQRLFSSKQRVALAVRDGGCRWRGCDRPASLCEAHHIDRYGDQDGRTDVDCGILLCRFHHMTLHHNGWRITRTRAGDFLLHSPDGSPPQILVRRLELRRITAPPRPPTVLR